MKPCHWCGARSDVRRHRHEPLRSRAGLGLPVICAVCRIEIEWNGMAWVPKKTAAEILSGQLAAFDNPDEAADAAFGEITREDGTVKETTQQREQRFRAETFAAMRAATTPEMRERAAADAAAFDPQGEPTWYPAGDLLTLKAGHRTITEDEGRVRAVAFADALNARGIPTIGYAQSFGLFAGRHTAKWTAIVAGARRI